MTRFDGRPSISHEVPEVPEVPETWRRCISGRRSSPHSIMPTSSSKVASAVVIRLLLRCH